MKKYDQCDTISKEMQELKQERRTFESELSMYNCKECRAQLYQNKKVKKAGANLSQSVQVNCLPTVQIKVMSLLHLQDQLKAYRLMLMLHDLVPPLVRLLVAMTVTINFNRSQNLKKTKTEQILISGLLARQN